MQLITTVEHPIFEDVIISDSLLEDISEFANSMDYSHYASHRGQPNVKKLADDNIMAKIAEWIVYDRFSGHIPDLSKPDMRIYEAHEKSWDPDLFSKQEGLTFLIKSCQNIGSLSWIIQRQNSSGKGGKDREFYENPRDNKIAVFVSVDVSGEVIKGRIKTTVPTTFLDERREDLFAEPRIERLIGIKHAIYYADLNMGGYGSHVAKDIRKYWGQLPNAEAVGLG